MSFTPSTGGFQFGGGGGGDAPKQGASPFAMPAAKPTGFALPNTGSSFGTPASTAAPIGGFSMGGAGTTPFSAFGATASPAPTSGFPLGGMSAAPTSGFSLGGTSTANTGFSLGGATTAPAPASASGFSLGGTAAPSTGFTLGSTPATSAPAATPAPAPTGFGLVGAATSSAPSGFSLGGTATTTTSTGFGLGGMTAIPASTGFSLGAATSTPAPASTGIGFGSTAPATLASSGFTLGSATTSAPSTGFSLGGTPASAPTAAAVTTISSSAPSFSFPAATSSAAPSLGTTTSAAPAFNLGASSSTVTAPTLATSTASTGAAPAPSCPAASLNFVQLEETINKWTMDLEEQEKLFMNQATQVNAWDHVLTANGEKIVALNGAVEAVKLEQQQLDRELDFILAQQRELEECLAPLEKELTGTAVTDPEREHTYELAEAMDTQLKQMSEDLKEIIEHLNESTRAQDSSDPLVQIGRILNAHMNALQWIDHNSQLIQTQLDQVTKIHDSHRRDNERSFHLS